MERTSDINAMLDERAITIIVNRLFVYTDQKNWTSYRALFVDGPFEVDMSSLNGGGPTQMTADDLIGGFKQGLHAVKMSHHMTSNYLIDLDGDTALLWAHGYSLNQLSDYKGGSDLWETWGTYQIGFRRTPDGWKIDKFGYFARYNRGNEYVRTHMADH